MEGKHVLAGWVAGFVLSSGIWGSVVYETNEIIAPTVIFGVLTVIAFIVWVTY